MPSPRSATRRLLKFQPHWGPPRRLATFCRENAPRSTDIPTASAPETLDLENLIRNSRLQIARKNRIKASSSHAPWWLMLVIASMVVAAVGMFRFSWIWLASNEYRLSALPPSTTFRAASAARPRPEVDFDGSYLGGVQVEALNRCSLAFVHVSKIIHADVGQHGPSRPPRFAHPAADFPTS